MSTTYVIYHDTEWIGVADSPTAARMVYDRWRANRNIAREAYRIERRVGVHPTWTALLRGELAESEVSSNG